MDNTTRRGRRKGGKNKIRTAEEKLEIIQQFYKSGLGYAKFADEHGIARNVLYSWIRKYQKDGEAGLRRKKASTTKITHELPADDDTRLMIINLMHRVEDLEKEMKSIKEQKTSI